ncbi:Scr1 family TA system antitoxin-like transcriptional regulator [Actinoallomurus rhizosphaericola]|uniref:Scr1 family TA system antitoxin-like transcriptional regulator n=1 Tax=Actinoallomurus rhizosphaericola TaxID=2952536 RepID=UPI0038735682
MVAKILDRHFQTGGLFELLLWYARKGHNPDWAQSVTAYETIARIFRIYQGQYVPTPSQTQKHARALLLASSYVKDVEEALKARMERQTAVLERPDPPWIWHPSISRSSRVLIEQRLETGECRCSRVPQGRRAGCPRMPRASSSIRSESTGRRCGGAKARTVRLVSLPGRTGKACSPSPSVERVRSLPERG